jgi:hypothetical protein
MGWASGLHSNTLTEPTTRKHFLENIRSGYEDEKEIIHKLKDRDLGVCVSVPTL